MKEKKKYYFANWVWVQAPQNDIVIIPKNPKAQQETQTGEQCGVFNKHPFYLIDEYRHKGLFCVLRNIYEITEDEFILFHKCIGREVVQEPEKKEAVH